MVGTEIHYLGTRLALCQVIFLVTCQTGGGKTFHKVCAVTSVAVDHIVYGALVVLLEHVKIEHVLTHKQFVGHLDHLVTAVLVEQDNVIQVRAVAYELVFLEFHAYESVGTVYVEFLVCLDNLCGNYSVKILYLSLALILCPVLVLEHVEPFDGYCNHVAQILVNAGYVGLHLGDSLLGLVLVELEDTGHLDLHQAEDIILGHLTDHLRIVRSQAVINMLTGSIHCRSLFKFTVFIDTLFNEYLFK